MGRNASYWSRNLLWSLLILQPKFVAVGVFFPNLPFKHHPSQSSCKPESNYDLPNPDVVLYPVSLIPSIRPVTCSLWLPCQSLQALLIFWSFLSAHPHRTHVFLDVMQGQKTRVLSKAWWSTEGRNEVRGSEICSKNGKKSCREVVLCCCLVSCYGL